MIEPDPVAPAAMTRTHLVPTLVSDATDWTMALEAMPFASTLKSWNSPPLGFVTFKTWEVQLDPAISRVVGDPDAPAP